MPSTIASTTPMPIMRSRFVDGVPTAIASALRCISRTVGAAATTPTRKNKIKCCDRIVAARPRTRPTRKSLSAKEADIAVFVIIGLFGVGPRSDAKRERYVVQVGTDIIRAAASRQQGERFAAPP